MEVSKKTSFILILIAVVSFVLASVWVVRSCNEEVSKATKNIPIVNKVVDRIQKKIPKILGGTKSDVVQETKEPVVNSFRFDTHLDIGVYSGVGLKNVNKYQLVPKPNLGMSFFSYGESKKRNKYRFLRVGVGGLPKNGVDITVSPVMINVGYNSKSAVFSNTYVHPFIGYNIQNKTPIVGVGLSISF